MVYHIYYPSVKKKVINFEQDAKLTSLLGTIRFKVTEYLKVMEEEGLISGTGASSTSLILGL